MLGRDFIEYILPLNHQITVANRGITNNHLFPNLKKIIIDRNKKDSCRQLFQENYDIVIDFSVNTQEQIENTIEFTNYNKYIYISTMTVLETEIFIQPDPANPYYHYAVGKLLAEDFVKNNIKNCTIIRPCAIYGENDYTDRFYKKRQDFYWKNSNQKAGAGTMHVRQLSEYIFQNAFNIEPNPEYGNIILQPREVPWLR